MRIRYYGEKTCPAGCHEFMDPFMTTARECKVNFNVPENTDTTLFDNTTQICADTDRRANAGWLFGDPATGAPPPWPSRTWDYMTMETTRTLWDIARTEVQILWGHTEVQKYMTACVRAYAADVGVDRGAGREERAYADDVILRGLETHGDLMRAWGRMTAGGFISPMYVAVERKSPVDHTKRLVFVQQDGLLGTSAADLLARRTMQHGQDLLDVTRRIFEAEEDAIRAVSRVIDVQTRLALIFSGTVADGYLEYIKTPSEFQSDVRTFSHFQASDLGPQLNMTDFYLGMAEVFEWDAARTAEFLERVQNTLVWAFKPAYFRALAREVYAIPIEDWKLYCKVSIFYDTMQFVPQAYAGPGVSAAHATTHRYRDKGSRGDARALGGRFAPVSTKESNDADRHVRMVRAYAQGKPADEMDIVAEEIEHADVPRQGMKQAWLMPTHAIRRPLWRTMSPRERRTVPQALRHPPSIKMVHRTGFANSEAARRTGQGLDSLDAQVEYSVFAETCAMLTYMMMPGHFDQLFVRAVADDDTIADVREMTENLISAAREIVSEMPLSETTRAEMLEKLRLARVRVGSQSPEFWFDPAEAIHSTQGTLLELSVRMRTATIAHGFELLFGSPVDDTDAERDAFSMPASIANAWFDPSANSLNLAAGIFLDPLYHKDFSPLTLYSRLGAVAAHEIGHAFDVDAGMEFDAHGTVRHWVSPEDVPTWNAWISCLVQQYSKRTRNGNVHDGLSTIAETMADTFGVQIAFRALERKLGRALSVDETQRFALSYSQLWAQQSDPDLEFSAIMFDEHAIPQFRINEVLRNLGQFALGVCGEQPRCVMRAQNF